MMTSWISRMRWAMVLAVGLNVSCYDGPPQMPPPPPPAVTTSVAAVRNVPVYLSEIGNVAATETVTLRSQVGGKVMQAFFVEGADVKEKQVLFEIDARPFKAALAQANAALAQAIASRDTARTDFARMEAVKGTSAISETEYDQKKGALAVAEAQVLAAEASVETATLNLEYCTIRSPISGRTGRRLVDPGNLVKENDTDLVVIQKMDPIFVDFTVTEDDLPTIKQHLDRSKLQVEIWLPSEFERMVNAASSPPTTQPASQPAAPPLLRPTRLGDLVFIDNAVREGTGTIKVRARVANDDRALWPGQYVRVRVILTVKEQAVLVPHRAVQISQTGPFVYVVHDGKAQMRPVKLGQKHGDDIVVESGVQGGEAVVVTGQMSIADGSAVTDVSQTPPATAPANDANSTVAKGEQS